MLGKRSGEPTTSRGAMRQTHGSSGRRERREERDEKKERKREGGIGKELRERERERREEREGEKRRSEVRLRESVAEVALVDRRRQRVGGVRAVSIA